MPSSRLKHFCQLCRKQCKDQNGFKCHINSASHQLRVRDYASNPLEHMERASQQFQGRFVQMVKTKYPGQPKYLEELYNQLIEQRKFLKFNHTQWKNLAEFGTYLQTVKNIQVVGAPPNCKIVYLVNKTKDFMESTKKQKLEADRQREKQQFEKSIAARIDRQKEWALRKEKQLNEQLQKLQEERSNMVIPDRLELSIEGFNADFKRSALFAADQLEKEVKQHEPLYKKKIDKIEKLYEELKLQNEHQDNEEEIQWLRAGITVRIKPHQIDPVFHNKKCKITKIVEPFVAEVCLGSAKIQIDQNNIETVIPKVGHQVMLLYGKYGGKVGVLKQVFVNEGYGVVTVDSQDAKMSFNFFSRYDPE